MSWPKSVPDYRWPAALLLPMAAPRRFFLNALFHISHALGRLIAFIRPTPAAVLIIRTDGLGDALLAEPMIASLSRQFLHQKLCLWAPAATCQLLQKYPFIAQRMTIPRGFKDGNIRVFRSPRWRAVVGYRLGRWKFDAAVYLVESPEPLGNWLLASVQTKTRWYNPGDTENQFAAQQAQTLAVATKVISPRLAGHELARNAAMASQWADDIAAHLPRVYADENAASQSQWCRWRQAADELGAEKIVGLVIGSAAAVKEFPPQNWAQVAHRLWTYERTVLALLGGAEDVAKLERLSALFAPTPNLRLNASLPLPALSALIARLDSLISVDTGLAHIALAQDIPAVILSGGGHPGRFLPWPIPRRAIVLNHPMPCAGCRNRCILPTPECVTRITPDEIVKAWARLSRSEAPSQTSAAA
jgi:ADP-heptose:LPS heptosyltransferase